ncbi:MAG: tetratricopeptide repeat protein [Leptolyngbya sp. SIO4C1]|nr:tetratricopeptide repeat protein [Leptolyngbya sp. SIO4C1]
MRQSTLPQQPILDSISATLSARRSQLQPYQLAEYHAAKNWLRRYRPERFLDSQPDDNLSQVRGYLEAFYHLSQVADWQSAHQVAFAQVGADAGAAQELHELLFIWGYYREQQRLHEGLLYRVSPEVDLVCLSSLGSLHDVWEQPHQAIEYQRQALALAQRLGSEAAKGTALSNLGHASLSLGELSQAIDYYQQHLKIAQALENLQSVGVALGNLGNAYRLAEAYDRALDYVQQRIELAQTIGDRKGEGEGYSSLGSLYLQQGRPTEAVELLERAVAIAQQIGHRKSECRAYGSLGLAYKALSDKPKAVDCFERAIALAELLEDREAQRLAILQLGELYQQLSRYPQAMRYQQQALAFVSDYLQVAALLLNLGSASRAVGQLAEAIGFYETLLTTVALLDETAGEKRLLHTMGLYCLALAHQASGDLKTAWRYCRAALDLADESTVPLIVKCLDLQQALAEEIGKSLSA